MSNIEERVMIQILCGYIAFNLCTTFYSLSNVKCYIKKICMFIPIIYWFFLSSLATTDLATVIYLVYTAPIHLGVHIYEVI